MSKTSNKKDFFKVKKLTRKQIQLLKQGRLPLSIFIGFMGGTGSQIVLSKDYVSEEGSFEAEILETETSEGEDLYDFEAPSRFHFAEKVSDDMSFAEAFKSARTETGAGGFFNWKGNSYHTLTKEEWDALPEEEQVLISKKIQENTNFESSDYHRSEEDDSFETVEEQDELDISDEENTNDEALTNEELELIDQITIEDIHFEEDDQFVELDEFGDTQEIIEGLNDGIAETEEDGISGGISETERLRNSEGFDVAPPDQEDYST